MIIKSKIQNMFRAAALLAPAFLLAACLGVDGDEGITFGSVVVAVKNFPEPACVRAVEIINEAKPAEGEEDAVEEKTQTEIGCEVQDRQELLDEQLSIWREKNGIDPPSEGEEQGMWLGPDKQEDEELKYVLSEDDSFSIQIGKMESEPLELKATLGSQPEALIFTAADFDTTDQMTKTFPREVQNNKNYTISLNGVDSCLFEENGESIISAKKTNKTFVVDCTEDADNDNEEDEVVEEDEGDDNEEDEIVEEDEVDEEIDGE